MKKLILIFIFTINILYGSDNYELKLYEKVLPIIFNQTYLKVFADSDTKDIIKNSDIFQIINSCKEADLLIGKHQKDFPTSCKEKPIFATTYRGFKSCDNSFGAFYWRKGRPQIKFKLEVIEKFNLNLSYSLKKYAK